MLQLKNVSIMFNSVPLFKNVSCSVEEGEVVVIVGANGSGKSTLFNLIMGNKTPDAGTIHIDGMDCTRLSARRRAPMISCLLQDTRANTVSDMTVAENMAMSLYKGKQAGLFSGLRVLELHHKVRGILKELNLEPLLTKSMGSLSGGQRQLIAFIMATVVPPKILLLDEPTAALDQQASLILLKFAKKFIKEHRVTTLLITHDQQIASTFGSRLWKMEDGALT